MENILALGAIVGFVNGCSLAFEKDWKRFGKFVVAISIGGVFGYFHWFGLTSVEAGFALGLVSSGGYKTLQMFADKLREGK